MQPGTFKLNFVFLVLLGVVETTASSQTTNMYPPFTKWYHDPLGLRPIELSSAPGFGWASLAIAASIIFATGLTDFTIELTTRKPNSKSLFATAGIDLIKIKKPFLTTTVNYTAEAALLGGLLVIHYYAKYYFARDDLRGTSFGRALWTTMAGAAVIGFAYGSIESLLRGKKIRINNAIVFGSREKNKLEKCLTY